MRGGIDYVCGNGIIEKDPNRIPSDEEIDRIIDHFSAKNLPFAWWTSAKVLETKGFRFGAILTGTVLDITDGIPAESAAPSDLKVEIIQSEADVKTFTELATGAFAMSATATEQWLGLNLSVMNHGEQIHFLARVEEIPVGTVTLSVSPLSAGIWNLTTLPEYRNRGIGAALVHAALAEAKKRQYSHVMALLIRQGMAWNLFTKLGFKEVCDFPFYVYSKEKWKHIEKDSTLNETVKE
jgi:GNAT superfamily N-acetyltransferase